MGFTTGIRRSLTLGVLVGLVAFGGAVAQSRSEDVPAAGLHAPCNAPVSAIKWIRVAPANEAVQLDRWCAGVGPPLVRSVPPATPSAPEIPVLVTWNTHEGGGNIDALVADLKAGRLTGHPVSSFVLLLQEVYRSGPDVPARAPAMPAWAAAELSPRAGWQARRHRGRRRAAEAGRLLRAVDAQRRARRHDRGSRQRDPLDAAAVGSHGHRAAARAPAARGAPGHGDVSRAPGGSALPLHVVCTHFTNMVMHHLWVLSESGRLRQARALSQVLPEDGALVVAGDFNAWFGDRDAAVKELAKVVPHVSSEDRRATFGPMRLDHVLARLPPGWRTTVRRADSRYGSDHYPLVASIEAR